MGYYFWYIKFNINNVSSDEILNNDKANLNDKLLNGSSKLNEIEKKTENDTEEDEEESNDEDQDDIEKGNDTEEAEEETNTDDQEDIDEEDDINEEENDTEEAEEETNTEDQDDIEEEENNIEEDEEESNDEDQDDIEDNEELNNLVEIDYDIKKNIDENTYINLQREDYDRILSGEIFSSQIWSGNILIEGDLMMMPWVEINILPGTRIEFTKSKDKTPSIHHIELGPDGFNDLDSSRLKPYTDKHISVFFNGKINANGTKDNPILFTSNVEDKYYNDWSSLVVNTDDAYFNNVIIEYCQACLVVVDPSENIIVENSIVRHGFWGCFSIANSNGVYRNNIAKDCGHEGFDIKGNSKLINNEVKDSHFSFFILGGNPTFENNRAQNYANDINDNEIRDGIELIEEWNCKETDFWRYEDYIIPCMGEPFLLN